MIASSAAFRSAVSQDSRTFRARFLLNNTEVSGDIRRVSVIKGSCGSTAFAPGTVFCPYIEASIDNCSAVLEGQELLLQIGVMTNNDYSSPVFDYINIGYFVVGKTSTNIFRTEFTAQGRVAHRLKLLFVPPQSRTLSAVIDQIRTITGMTISVDEGIDLTGTMAGSLSALTCREALSAVATVIGGFAAETEDGEIRVSTFNTTATASFTYSRMLELPAYADYNASISGVTVKDLTGTQLFTEGSNPNFEIVSEHFTEDTFDAFADNLIGLSYRAGRINLALGDPRIEPWDAIGVTNEGITIVTPCMSICHTFDGGIRTIIEAPSLPDEEQTGSPATRALAIASEALGIAREAILSATAFYKISASGTNPDDIPYRSSSDEDIRSTDGEDIRIILPVYEWSETAPENIPPGMYLWTKIEVTYSDGSTSAVYTVTESNRQVFSETALFYLSTSSSSLSGGSWSETLPAFVKNRYYWRRTRRLYTDNTVDYTDPVLDSENNALDQQGVFNRLTNNGAAQGLYIDPSTGDVYVNASYIMSGAFVITDSNGNEIFRADKTGKVFRWDMAYSSLSELGELTLRDHATESSGLHIIDAETEEEIVVIDACGFAFWKKENGKIYRYQFYEHSWLDWERYDSDGTNDYHVFNVVDMEDDSLATSGMTINGRSLEDRIAYISASGSSSNLTKPSSLTNFSFGSTWACVARKNKAGVVTVHYNFNGYFTATGTSGGTLFTLPSGYRPAATMYLNKVNQSGTRYLLTLNTNGTVTLANASGASGSSNQNFRDVITFVTA